jgi:hypothetical protein
MVGEERVEVGVAEVERVSTRPAGICVVFIVFSDFWYC